jgi:hypothetical protein
MPDSNLVKVALDAITAELSPLIEEGRAEIPPRLRMLAEETARYWESASRGDAEAEKNLKFLQSEARMIVARYALKSQAAAARTAERVVGVIARIGFMVLKAGLGIPSLPGGVV